MRYIEEILLGIYVIIIVGLWLLLSLTSLGGCLTDGASKSKDEVVSLNSVDSTCQVMDSDAVIWALQNKFKVRSQDEMQRDIKGEKISHFRRVIFNSQLTVFIYFINVKDTEKLAEYASLFKFISSCKYGVSGQYKIFMEYRTAKKQPNKKGRLI